MRLDRAPALRGWRIYKIVGSVKQKSGCAPGFGSPGNGGQVPPHIYSIPLGDHDGFF
jgi:hypothetical protein